MFFKKKNKECKIKLLICDIDGTMTDGKMYYTKNGKLFKVFSTKDAQGFEIAHKNNIEIMLLTSDDDRGISVKRAKDLDLKIKTGIKYKWGFIEKEILTKYDLEEIAYIGDDMNDYTCLQKIPLKACPKDANFIIKKIKGIIKLKRNGGDGCVREFIDKYLI